MTKEEYEKSLREVGWDEDCIFAAVHGFSMGYTRAIADVVEWLKEGSAHPESSSCSAGECDICDKEYVAGLVENKFLKGENENS